MKLSFKKQPIGNLIFENRDKCQEKMTLCGRNEWRKFGNYLPVTQSDVNLWYIENNKTLVILPTPKEYHKNFQVLKATHSS